MIAGGLERDQILDEYPELTEDDIAEALDYAATVIDEDRVIPRS